MELYPRVSHSSASVHDHAWKANRTDVGRLELLHKGEIDQRDFASALCIQTHILQPLCGYLTWLYPLVNCENDTVSRSF